MPELMDVVYILKEDIDPRELRYSLRSVAKNFPHRRVWFVGGQPEGLYPDGRIAHKQIGQNKWENVRSSLFKVLECKDITDDFFLFNDDFFIMKPFEGEFINYVGGTLEYRIREVFIKNGENSRYTEQLSKARAELLFDGFDAMSFCVHLPMLINKQKAREVLSGLGSPMFRSIYGNRARVPYIYHEDVKVYDLDTVPPESCDYLSTLESSFNNGKVGEFIRRRFNTPCRFENPKNGGSSNG